MKLRLVVLAAPATPSILRRGKCCIAARAVDLESERCAPSGVLVRSSTERRTELLLVVNHEAVHGEDAIPLGPAAGRCRVCYHRGDFQAIDGEAEAAPLEQLGHDDLPHRRRRRALGQRHGPPRLLRCLAQARRPLVQPLRPVGQHHEAAGAAAAAEGASVPRRRPQVVGPLEVLPARRVQGPRLIRAGMPMPPDAVQSP
mmetsp:Transcript_137432/g.439034  ORF Transcript_137432/g.439034 Transcript_137432/m.439034 type:complete len:200 (+) Transcript_137432:249-848(+)